MEPLPPFPFVNVNLEILYTAKGNFYYFLYTHKFKLQGFKRELTKLAVDFSLGGSVKKFPLINSKRPDFLPGTCLILQGPFNNVFVALKYYFKKWGGLNTHISYLQGLTELNQEEIRFTVLKTEIKPSSENSSGVKQNGQNIPRSDPLPHLDIDKEFTKNFLKACKTDRPTPISETEEKIKSYIVNLTHKYTFLSFKLILNRVPLKVLDDLISAAKSFTTTESTKFNRITTNTNTSFSQISSCLSNVSLTFWNLNSSFYIL